MRDIRVSITTDGSGDGTTTSSVACNGALYALQLVDGNFDDGVDITVTFEQGDLSIPVLTQANFNSDQMSYPRAAAAAVADGSALTTYALPVALGYPKVVVAQGGNAKSGSFIFYVVPL